MGVVRVLLRIFARVYEEVIGIFSFGVVGDMWICRQEAGDRRALCVAAVPALGNTLSGTDGYAHR